MLHGERGTDSQHIFPCFPRDTGSRAFLLTCAFHPALLCGGVPGGPLCQWQDQAKTVPGPACLDDALRNNISLAAHACQPQPLNSEPQSSKFLPPSPKHPNPKPSTDTRILKLQHPKPPKGYIQKLPILTPQIPNPIHPEFLKPHSPKALKVREPARPQRRSRWRRIRRPQPLGAPRGRREMPKL